MLIHLSDVLSLEDGTRNYEVPLEFSGIAFQGITYPVLHREPVKLEIHHGKEKKVKITFTVSLVLQMACDRCLSEVDVPFSFTDSVEADMAESAEERIQNLEEAAYIDEYTLDVDKLIEGELYLHMPMKVLCSEDCRGLKAETVGETETAENNEAGLDPRMAVIRDLFQNMNQESDKEV